jgi:hypothetical protein
MVALKDDGYAIEKVRLLMADGGFIAPFWWRLVMRKGRAYSA